MKQVQIRLSRDSLLPDPLRVARAASAPHLGPRILFFSGGSALNGIARKLKTYTHNSVHLITPFDSGGSSKVLREVFDMPAVGDLRSRLMALADESVLGQPQVYALFSHRLPRDGSPAELRTQVERMARGKHPLISAISKPMRPLIQTQLDSFLAHATADFDYRYASIGNLILAGGYLSQGRALEPVLFMMSKMVDVRGTVRAIVDETLHLGADLAGGGRVIGQRQISGKEAPPLAQPITRLFLTDGSTETRVSLPKRNRKAIAEADVLCYPPGSLYSSVIANLLPEGTGSSIAARHVPKVYLPSLGHDPEAIGHDLADQVGALLAPLLADAGPEAQPRDMLTHVLCDPSMDAQACAAVTARFGIDCLRLPLAQDAQPRYDTDSVARVLVSLA
ncbi:GAK system CofD-like protein [Sagittula sp. SSi028]|uniref:GAK system CofD-like protein n=1 Tax=Sagittula sp. SSi028 TaxID=3400636 RepID=UPI003AF78D7D